MVTKDRIQNVVEYLLSVFWILAGVSLIGEPPLQAPGVIVLVLGGQIALYVYMVWFFLLGAGLLYSKFAHKRRLHKGVLMAMYLTPIYTSCLFMSFFGFDLLSIVDDIVVGLLAAWCWIRHKFKEDYVDLCDVAELP